MGEDGEMVRRHRIRLGLAVIVLIAIFGVITFTVLVVAKALANDGPRITETPMADSPWKDNFERDHLWMATSSAGPNPPGQVAKVGNQERVVTMPMDHSRGRRTTFQPQAGKL